MKIAKLLLAFSLVSLLQGIYAQNSENIAWVYRSDYVLGSGFDLHKASGGNTLEQDQLSLNVLPRLRGENLQFGDKDHLVRLFVAEVIQDILYNYFFGDMVLSVEREELQRDQDALQGLEGMSPELVKQVISFISNAALTNQVLDSYKLFSRVKVGANRGEIYINRETFSELNKYINMVYSYVISLLLGDTNSKALGDNVVAELKRFSSSGLVGRFKDRVPQESINKIEGFKMAFDSGLGSLDRSSEGGSSYRGASRRPTVSFANPVNSLIDLDFDLNNLYLVNK